MHKIFAGLTLLGLLLQTGSIAPVNVSMTDWGLQLGFVTFRDGSSVTVLYQEIDGISQISFVYTDEHGGTLTAKEVLPVLALPDLVVINVCGTHVQASANWTTGNTPASAPVYRFDWQLPEDSGLCTSATMYFPFIQQRGSP